MHTLVTHPIRMGDLDGKRVLIRGEDLRSPAASVGSPKKQIQSQGFQWKSLIWEMIPGSTKNRREEVRQGREGNQ